MDQGKAFFETYLLNFVISKYQKIDDTLRYGCYLKDLRTTQYKKITNNLFIFCPISREDDN